MKEKAKRKTIQNKREYKILFPTMRGENLSSTHSPSKDDSTISIDYINDLTTAPSVPNLASARQSHKLCRASTSSLMARSEAKSPKAKKSAVNSNRNPSSRQT